MDELTCMYEKGNFIFSRSSIEIYYIREDECMDILEFIFWLDYMREKLWWDNIVERRFSKLWISINDQRVIDELQ